MGIDNQLVGRQELINHAHSHLHEASSIATQVYHVALGTFVLEFDHGLHEFAVGVAAKLVHLDVARVLVEHIMGIDSIHWNAATSDREGQGLVTVQALDA